MSTASLASEQLKELAGACSADATVGAIEYPQMYLGFGRTVVASAQQRLSVDEYSIHAIGSVHDSGTFANLVLNFVTPSRYLPLGRIHTMASVHLLISDEDVAISVNRQQNEYARTPLKSLVSPLGKWALETFPAAEAPSTEFVNLFRQGDPSRDEIERLKANLNHPLDDSVDVTELTDFFTAESASPRLFKWVQADFGRLVMRLDPPIL